MRIHVRNSQGSILSWGLYSLLIKWRNKWKEKISTLFMKILHTDENKLFKNSRSRDVRLNCQRCSEILEAYPEWSLMYIDGVPCTSRNANKIIWVLDSIRRDSTVSESDFKHEPFSSNTKLKFRFSTCLKTILLQARVTHHLKSFLS
jgi:hypothetical protein